MAYVDTWEYRVIERLMCREPYISMDFGKAWALATRNAKAAIADYEYREAHYDEECRLCLEGEAV